MNLPIGKLMSRADSSAQPQIGKIDDSLLSYVTPGIIIALLAISSIVVMSFDQLAINFKTNVPLNGLIVGILLIGVGSSIYLNITLWRAAQYLNELDDVIDNEKLDESTMQRLRKELTSRAPFLDTKNMAGLVANIGTFGHLNVSDNDARLIKSKLGSRLNSARGKATFLGGLLVMLGLLGTFWGLLLTIDAVGAAMSDMSNLSEEGGMSNFIAGIAAPLQGMGLAFSSSLFGLSGSLMVGTFKQLSGNAQDQFVEKFSRWIDEHIPQPNEAMKSAARSPKVSGSDELKAWLAGFVQTSQITHRKISELVTEMSESIEANRQTAATTAQMLEAQSSMQASLANLDQAIAASNQNSQRLSEVLTTEFTGQLVSGQEAVAERLSSLNNAVDGLAKSTAESSALMQGYSSTVKEVLPAAINAHGQEVSQSLTRVKEAVSTMQTSLDGFKTVQKPVINSLQQLNVQLTKQHNESVSTLKGLSTALQPVTRINAVSEQMTAVLKSQSDSHREQIEAIEKLHDTLLLMKSSSTSQEQQARIEQLLNKLSGVETMTAMSEVDQLLNTIESELGENKRDSESGAG